MRMCSISRSSPKKPSVSLEKNQDTRSKVSYGLRDQVCHLFPRGVAGPCLLYIFPVVFEPLEFLLVVVVQMCTVLSGVR